MNKFLGILIIILIAVIVLMRACTPEPVNLTEYIKIDGKEYILLSSKRDTIWEVRDSIIPEYIPQLIKGDTEYVEVPADVDTLNILKEFFAIHTYKDTIRLDSIGYIIISDAISQNKIISRNSMFNYKIPTFTETITVKDKPKHKFYIGVGFNVATFNEFKQVYGSVLWKTKQDRMYNLAIGVVNVNSQTFASYGIGVHWRIGKKNN